MKKVNYVVEYYCELAFKNFRQKQSVMKFTLIAFLFLNGASFLNAQCVNTTVSLEKAVTGFCSAEMTFAAPTIETCDMANLNITNQGNSGAMLSTDLTMVTIPAGLKPNIYTVEFELTDCDGMVTTCETSVRFAPNSGCAAININPIGECGATINASDMLTNMFGDNSQYTIYIDDVQTNMVSGPGVYDVSVRYTPTVAVGETNAFSGDEICWNTVRVEDKNGPVCNLAVDEINEVCGLSTTITPPTFTDCSSFTANAVTIDALGVCGDIPGVTDGGADLLNELITGTVQIHGVTVPAPSNASAFISASFALDRVIRRGYSSTDSFGNVGESCFQYTYIWRPTNIVIPTSTSVACGTDIAPAVLAGLDPQFVPYFANPLFVAANPVSANNQQFLPLFGSDHAACNFTLLFEDTFRDATCGNAEKLIRRWSVLDCCAGTLFEGNQFVETTDTEAPVIVDCPIAMAVGAQANPFEIAVNAECQATFDISMLGVTATDNCGDVSDFTAKYFSIDATTNVETKLGDGSSIVLTKGLVRASVVATDQCGNESAPCDYFINVTDNITPVILTRHVKITLDNTGMASLCADSIATATDNCGAVMPLMIRVVSTPENAFTRCAPLSCVQLDFSNSNNAVVMVEIQATDECNNTTTSMCPITLQINNRPSITCPANSTVACLADVPAPTQMELDAMLSGICNQAFEVRFEDNSNTGMCTNSGSVTRTFSVFLNGVALSPAVTCQQTITINDNIAPTFVEALPQANLGPVNCDQIPNVPVLTATDNCDLTSIVVVLDSTQVAVGTCPNDFVRTRTWTATDVCGNSVVHTQEITVQNVAPSVNAAANQSVDCMMMDGFVYPEPIVVSSCAASNVMISTPVLVPTTLANGDIQVVATFTVTDDCGLNATSSTTVTFTNCCIDLILPSATINECTSGTSNITVNLPANTTVSISQLRFVVTNNADPLDTQTQDGNNVFSFVKNTQSVLYDIVVTSIDPSIVLCNSANQIAGCTARAIAGRVFNEEFESIEDVEVELMNTEIPMSMTDIDGEYTFEDLENQEYTVAAHKENDPANGISTFDLVVMAQHVLGINPLSTPYKLIAADVNMDEEIDILDLIELRELILYTIQDFTVNDSWRFIDAEYEFPDPRNPWLETIPATHTMDLGTEDAVVDFIAVKIGDLDCSAQTKSNLNSLEERSNKTMVLYALNQTVKVGTSFDVVLNPSSDITLSSAQFTLHFDASIADFSGITSASLELKNSFSEMYMEEGLVPFAWYTHKAKNLDAATDLVFTFTAKQDLSVSELLTIDSELTPALAYAPNGTQYDVQLNILDTNLDVNQSIVLHQNKPNPFSDASIIGFELPNEQSVSITIFDIDGKLLYSKDVEGTAGYNQVELTADEISKTGVLFYQLNTDDYSVTKKMIILE